jgi:hypothetical protein
MSCSLAGCRPALGCSTNSATRLATTPPRTTWPLSVLAPLGLSAVVLIVFVAEIAFQLW